jgi:branched-chain amino acid transport system substrate-binding protein
MNFHIRKKKKRGGFSVKRKILAMSLIAAALFGVAGCGSTTSATAPAKGGEIGIGLTAPLSGDNAEYGKVFNNSLELAIEKVNNAGGINGKKLKLSAADSKSDPKEAANIAQKFVSDESILAVVGDFTSTAALAAAPVYQKGGLVELSPTSSHPDFTKQGTYMFRNIATQETEGPLLADYAIKDLKKKKIAVIYIKNDWGLVAKDNFIKGVKNLSGEIVAEEPFLPEQGKDFSAIITKVKATNPDLLFIAAMYADTSLIAQQARKADFKVDLMGTGSLYSDELLKNGGAAIEGLYLDCSFYPQDQRPEVQEYVAAYTQKYGKAPTMFAAQAYDAANLIIEALKAGATDRKSLRDKLATIKDYPGVTGKTTFDENRNVQKALTKLVVKDNKFVPFQQ